MLKILSKNVLFSMVRIMSRLPNFIRIIILKENKKTHPDLNIVLAKKDRLYCSGEKGGIFF